MTMGGVSRGAFYGTRLRGQGLRPLLLPMLILGVAAALGPKAAMADESGISFWLPGLFGSFAAVPAQPGWAFTTLGYHSTVDAGAGQAFERGGRIETGLAGRGDLLVFGPSYVLE